MSPRTIEILLSEQELVWLGRAVLRDIPDAVIFADREGIIRFWNSGAVRIFGFDTEEALGRSLDIIIPERLRERHWAGYHHMMETGQSQHHPDELLSVPAQTSRMESISVQFTVAPVLEEDGRPAGIVAILRDVTGMFLELKRLRARAMSHVEAGVHAPAGGRK